MVRVIVGVLFFGHGAQKLFGWFGGYGIEGTGGFFEKLGFPNGKLQAASPVWPRPAAASCWPWAFSPRSRSRRSPR